MSVRYPLLSQALAAAGAFVALVTFAFAHGTANAIDFGVIIGITVAGLAALAVAPRTRSQLVLNAIALLVGAWTVLVTAGILSGATQRWLTFAGGVASRPRRWRATRSTTSRASAGRPSVQQCSATSAGRKRPVIARPPDHLARRAAPPAPPGPWR